MEKSSLTQRETIFLVDDDMTNLVAGRNALYGKYNFFTIASGEKLFAMLLNKKPDLILLDVNMPFMDGYDVIKILKYNPDTKNIPVIFLTANIDAESEMKGLSLGAVDYITKPFSAPLLLKRIEIHLLLEKQRKELLYHNENLKKIVNDKTKVIVNLKNAVLTTISELVESRDVYTGKHIQRTQEYLRLLTEEIMSRNIYSHLTKDWEMELLVSSSQLHDVGKISIPDGILLKPSSLTKEEFEIMKKHVEYGMAVIESIKKLSESEDFFYHANLFISSHHERWNGQGYPKGIMGEEIPLQGRLMALVDVYDALTSVRPYKKIISHDVAKKIILESIGTHFDPKLIEVFDSINDKFKMINDKYQEYEEN